jgi:hypothetical protein
VEKLSDEELVGRGLSDDLKAGIEMQRRLMVEIKRFNRSSTWLAGIVIFVAVLQLGVAGLQVWIAFKQNSGAQRWTNNVHRAQDLAHRSRARGEICVARLSHFARVESDGKASIYVHKAHRFEFC